MVCHGDLVKILIVSAVLKTSSSVLNNNNKYSAEASEVDLI